MLSLYGNACTGKTVPEKTRDDAKQSRAVQHAKTLESFGANGLLHSQRQVSAILLAAGIRGAA